MKNNTKRFPLWLALGLLTMVALTACSGIIASTELVNRGGSIIAEPAESGQTAEDTDVTEDNGQLEHRFQQALRVLRRNPVRWSAS
jgi:type VI protein secretion system component VasK